MASSPRGTVVVMLEGAGSQVGPPALYHTVSETPMTSAGHSPVFWTKMFPAR